MNLNDLSDDIIIEEKGPLVKIRLNRPAVLNALNLEMIRIITATLRKSAADDNVKAVAFTTTSEKAFCAGGDMRAVYQSGMAFRRDQVPEKVASVFFGEEYAMNRLIYEFPKPVLALMPGVVMGGAYGIAGPCDFRLACENTVFAMPEVAIGFFPDVGCAYYLNKCPGKTGRYLALTGNRINADDMVYTGLASHIVPFPEREKLLDRIADALDGEMGSQAAREAVKSVIEAFARAPVRGELRQNQRQIDQAFSAGTVEAILQKLEGSDWGREVLETLGSRSPTSIKVVLAHMNETEGMSYPHILEKDFTLAQHFMRGHDFYEGVRAVLIDKDHAPRWDPSAFSEVNPALIEEYFAPTDLGLDSLPQ